MRDKKDRLTGLLDKDSCMTQIREYLAGESKEGAAIVLDIDGLNQVNKMFGMEKGDEILQETANTLREFFHEEDIISRIQGGRFVIFAKNIKQGTNFDIRLHELCTTLEKTISDGNSSLVVTASIGVAVTSDMGRDFDTIYYAASEAMDEVKRHGKGSVKFWSGR
ncbi:MAG: GGDEF domain-containing protein [Clostridiaceae bacterium]|nr:GGDEF domain-containing protein [Clostridiaceae bacterium]